jgi:hypothetical protein
VGTALQGAREFTPQLYCCSTAAAKKNDGGRLVIPQGLQIGFCSTTLETTEKVGALGEFAMK